MPTWVVAESHRPPSHPSPPPPSPSPPHSPSSPPCCCFESPHARYITPKTNPDWHNFCTRLPILQKEGHMARPHYTAKKVGDQYVFVPQGPQQELARGIWTV